MRKDTRLSLLFRTACDGSWAEPGNKATIPPPTVAMISSFDRLPLAVTNVCLWLVLGTVSPLSRFNVVHILITDDCTLKHTMDYVTSNTCTRIICVCVCVCVCGGGGGGGGVTCNSV